MQIIDACTISSQCVGGGGGGEERQKPCLLNYTMLSNLMKNCLGKNIYLHRLYINLHQQILQFRIAFQKENFLRTKIVELVGAPVWSRESFLLDWGGDGDTSASSWARSWSLGTVARGPYFSSRRRSRSIATSIPEARADPLCIPTDVTLLPCANTLV